MVTSGFIAVLIALLPLAIVAVTMAWRDRAWSTREVPGAAFRLGIGALFAACVVPAWGLLAAQATAWWWVRGWVIKSGGLLWPTAAAVVWMGLQAPQAMLDAGLVLALAMGVVQSALGVSQWRNWPLFNVGGQVMGTLGHRTGLGIYLGMLIPLAFSTDYAWWLVAAYLPGLVLSRSSVGYAAAVCGLLVVQPALAPLLGVAMVLGLGHRFVKWNGGAIKPRLLEDAFRARLSVWAIALWKTQRWPFWLIGHGGDSFHEDGRTWIYNHRLHERYKEAHNDYVEFVYEYGLVGLVALVWYAYTIADGLSLGDPATGALAGASVASLGNFPVRVAPIVGLAALCLILVMRRLV
jgi:hypothetical protein